MNMELGTRPRSFISGDICLVKTRGTKAFLVLIERIVHYFLVIILLPLYTEGSTLVDSLCCLSFP
jgi:hypothetical protein